MHEPQGRSLDAVQKKEAPQILTMHYSSAVLACETPGAVNFTPGSSGTISSKVFQSFEKAVFLFLKHLVEIVACI